MRGSTSCVANSVTSKPFGNLGPGSFGTTDDARVVLSRWRVVRPGRAGVGHELRQRVLFERFVRLIGACGPYEVAPARTRVAFMASVRFASVNRLGAASLDAHFVLPETVASPRFRRVERLGKLTVHHLRFTEPQQMDEEVQAWLRRSYAEYGERRWLKRPSTATGRVRRASSVPRQRRKATRPRSRARTA